MPIKFNKEQTVISCQGDILVLPFSPKQKSVRGIAWLLLQERTKGEVGREPTKSEVDDEIHLDQQPGVLIAANDYRSLNVIIDALTSLRDDLMFSDKKEKREEKTVPTKVEIHTDKSGKTFVSGLCLHTIEAFEQVSKLVDGHVLSMPDSRNLIGKTCIWPKDIEPFSLMGKIIVLDGELVEILGYVNAEGVAKIQRGKQITLLTQRFKKEINEDDLL